MPSKDARKTSKPKLAIEVIGANKRLVGMVEKEIERLVSLPINEWPTFRPGEDK